MLVFEYIVAALIVIACSLFSAWRLLSARLRLRLLDTLGALAGKAGATADATVFHWLGHLRRKAMAQLGSGCNACAVSEHRRPNAADRPARDVSVTFRPVNRSSAAPRR